MRRARHDGLEKHGRDVGIRNIAEVKGFSDGSILKEVILGVEGTVLGVEDNRWGQ